MYAHPSNTQSAIHELHSDGPENRNEAYASVGGLDAQVQQVRDLLEIPLTRPELFRHYGTNHSLIFFLPPASLLLSLDFSCLQLFLLLKVSPCAISVICYLMS
jgi:hypothetical protein